MQQEDVVVAVFISVVCTLHMLLLAQLYPNWSLVPAFDVQCVLKHVTLLVCSSCQCAAV
jgi:hypothetical protein